jgi:hypothetical protein
MTDLKVMALGEELSYVDTAWFEESENQWEKKPNPKKLKDLVKINLNATIQEKCHSSVSFYKIFIYFHIVD